MVRNYSFMKYDVITIGAAVRDIFLFLEAEDSLVINNPRRELTRKRLLGLEYGAKINSAKSMLTAGGGALNSAVTFSRLGLKVGAVGGVGADDDAKFILKSMKKEKVSDDFMARIAGAHTGFSVLLVPGGHHDHVAIVERGASEELEFNPRQAAITSANWYYTTALSGPNWRQTLDKIIFAVKSKKINWAWNPGSAQLEQGVGGLGRYLKHCQVLLVNRDEALGLVSERGSDANIDNPKKLLEFLISWGPKIVVITDGVNGAYYADSDQTLMIKTDRDVERVECTGAGDSFGSGFVSGLIATNMQNPMYALDLGITNSESVIQHVGAQKGILRQSELKKKLGNKKHRISRIK